MVNDRSAWKLGALGLALLLAGCADREAPSPAGNRGAGAVGPESVWLTVQADYAGASPEEVESELTGPVELALVVLPELRCMRSISREGQGTVERETRPRANRGFGLGSQDGD